MNFASIEHLESFAAIARVYRVARRERPDVPASRLLAAVRRVEACEAYNLDEALCPGHEWAYSGDDESHGRCYCVYCGADGDA